MVTAPQIITAIKPHTISGKLKDKPLISDMDAKYFPQLKFESVASSITFINIL
jgi:hypothetical protein